MNIDGNFPSYERQTTILQNTEQIKTILPTIGKTKRARTFLANGSFTIPAGVTEVYITGGGGGGGGGVYVSSAGVSTVGSTGGATSFGNLLTLIGGAGGRGTSNATSAIGGIKGGPGGQSAEAPLTQSGTKPNGNGGSSGPYYGGLGSQYSGVGQEYFDGGYCSGGGALLQGTGAVTGGGGADFVYHRPVTVIPGTTYTITIGIGGAGATNSGYVSGKGGNGILTIEWWE